MTSKNDIVKPKTVKIYELDDFEKLLKGVKVATCMLTESPTVVDEASVIKRLNTLTLNGAAEGNCCSCCGVGPFESRAQQTAHYKHHWHTHNLKRKLFGKTALTYGQFNSRQDDDSSVSGSDSETEGGTDTASELFAAATRHCKAFYTNQNGQVFCIYRCLLHHRKEHLSTDGDGTLWVARCRQLLAAGAQRWAVLMVSGGHFAGAIYSGSVAAVHKTHHSYVSRRGQGQAQIARDQHGSAPRSAGASLRRYNQAQFLEHVQEIMSSWSDDLSGCSTIFYRAVGAVNQGCLFGKSSPVSRDDPRVRALPFPTRKPTFKEVQRVHETLASVEVYDTMELFQKALMVTLANKSANKPANKSANKSGSDTSVANAKRPVKASPNKPIDRAKSRERAPRELPIVVTSSEDEGPSYIDSETPAGWIKTLSEQSSRGIITNSRKDLINDINDCSIASTDDSECEEGNTQQRKASHVKKKNKKKQDEGKNPDVKSAAKKPPKIPASVKNMWKLISGKEQQSLETILEGWESSEDLEAACNTQDPVDGNTALHKAAIAAKPEMVAQLLSCGGDPCIRNHLQQTPYAASPHNDTRVAFRLFQAQNPHKYNYAKSHIPGPLTPELLEQEKERKAQQKRAKRQRDKEKQAEKIKMNKFLALTDVQKLKSGEQRCFLCGGGLPKTAFEYESFKFCSIQCLKGHRSLRPLNMSEF